MPNQFTTSRVDVTCRVCSKVFGVKPSQAERRVTCSEECRYIFRSGPRIPIADRFWANVGKAGPPHPTLPDLGPCWLWTKSTRNGYGQISVGALGESKVGTHIVAWTLAGGVAPGDDDVIGHTCDVRACVRNDGLGTYTVDGVEYERRGHLFLTVALGNMRDMVAKGRQYLTRQPATYHPTHGRVGETHWKVKLTDADVLEIRRTYAAGEADQKTLASMCGVSQAQISAIVRHESWKHLP
jgi:hypothetical protein